MKMPPARFVCEFNTDAPAFYLAEDFRSSEPGQVKRVFLYHPSGEGACVSLRRYHVLRLVYRWQPLTKESSTSVYNSPVAERTPLNHAVVEMRGSLVTTNAGAIHVLFAAAGEVLELSTRREPFTCERVDSVVGLQLREYLIVPDGIRVQQFPLFAIAFGFGNLP